MIESNDSKTRYLIGRYHEIVLKGRNRWRFVEQLKHNVRAAFADFRLSTMRSEGPRLMVGLPGEISDAIAAERGRLIFGLQNFSLSHPVPLDIEALKREAVAIARESQAQANTGRAPAATFRVSAR